MKLNTVGIVGAGVMGMDIALCCAAYDFRVVLKDVNQQALDKAKESALKNLRMYKMMNPVFKNFTPEQLLSQIDFVLDYDAISNAHWVIENVTEDWNIKETVYRELAEVCKPETRYAVNTSCISITKVAALMPDPSQVIGMHFMNPAPLKKGVEVMLGFHTSEETKLSAKEFLKRLAKQAIIVNDMPGFVANRLSHLFMNEAAFLVQDNVAEPAAIDNIFKQGYGHAMGPLETADLIGLDTVVQSLKVLYDSFQDSKFRCCPLLQKMVDAGQLGRKTGQGFYSY
ncbi:3-hydroxyacyl-CoA dehydrogenase family protein [Pleionea sp. CnH1-48]|uniref:3-hydroxyacyl-CoA dehydrogenase family protein n=1 Tax=Pleionea sp. CnH1-48 TaxID=2954494 RepID=UPI0020979532|nr:3-hydroxyacyl-CoA dehydrogenase family protein [Pleionea sp. CnH1-48]MCO7224341.1 3-hydroxyacyl-CoA dehydrogenase family protein [Pleionea sp. CnH1-48]